MDYETRVSKLIALHFSGLITECEEEELQNLLRENPTTATLFLRLREDDMFRESYLQQKKWDVEKAILKFDTLTGKKSKVLHKRFLWSCAAAVLIGILVGGTWFIKFRTERIKQPEKVLLAEKVVPGNSKAILKLGNGRLISLSDSVAGIFIANHVDVKECELVYTDQVGEGDEFNELVLPRGGEYRLVLSDGTSVRLNSGSILRYPVSFSGKERTVELSGEAFFEVATDSLRPFSVKTDGLVVKAYGTSFNINTHKPGHVYTALVEGCVGVIIESSGQEYEMTPSQLADFNPTTNQLEIWTTDLSPYISWVEGRFLFINETLEQIMNTLSLWYDFEVLFEQEELRQLHFSGSMKRYEQIDRTLDAISYTVNVSMNWRGKTLIIRKK